MSEPEHDRPDDEREHERQTQGGFLRVERAQAQANADLVEVAATLRALTRVLVDRGVIPEASLDRALADARTAAQRSMPPPRVRLDEAPGDKHMTPNAEVDCAARMPLCRGACCTMQVALSLRDVEERKLAWELGRPYLLRKAADRRCVYQQRDTGFCGSYDDRPRLCRSYSCAGDVRIWRDFEGRVPNVKGIEALLAQECEEPLVLLRVTSRLPVRDLGGG